MKYGLLLLALIALAPACQMRKENGKSSNMQPAAPMQEVPAVQEESMEEMDVMPAQEQMQEPSEAMQRAMDDEVMEEETMDDAMDIQENE